MLQARGRKNRRNARLLTLLCVSLTSCTGAIEAPAGAGNVATVDPASSDPPSGAGPQGSAFVPAAASLRRLTVREYQNSVNDLFDAQLSLATELEADTALKGFTSIGASELTIAHTTAEKLEAAALEIVAELFADPARRVALVGCEPGSIGDACVGEFLKRFGRRAYRRPLEEAELASLRQLGSTLDSALSDVWESLSYVVTAFLQSPHFVFRVEVGEPDPEQPARLRYSSIEMASRLAFVLWESMPDEELLAAGERGELVEVEALRREAERLLASPRAKPALARFFAEHLALDRLETLSKEVAVYPQMSASLPAAMRGELERMFEHVVFERDADVRELLDTRTTFVNGELAQLYGLSGVEGAEFTQVELPEAGLRAGILGTAGLLAIQATTTNTSPTRRGKFVRNRLLCQEIEAPPPDVVTVLPPADANKTMRERLTLHRTEPSCAGCHQLMDPLGLAFENFNGIGAYREDDRGMSLDVTGDLDGVSFSGPRELMELIRESASLPACFVQQLYRFATGHQESRHERLLFERLTDDFVAGGYRLPALLLEIVTSDGFRYAAPTE